ncbi:MAG: tetratricopeptide repeat protein [Bacteroidales bacterium]
MTAKKVDTTKTEERIHSVEEALTRTEEFIEKNQKIILIVVGAIIVIVLGFFGFRKYYLEPLEKEAQEQLFMAQIYFEQDSLALALNGDGNYLGFLDISDQYGMTKAANLANYYSGICYLKTGDYQSAIDYLEDFDGTDEVVAPLALGGIGDAYMELDQPEKAVSYYKRGADNSKNELTAPMLLMKAGIAYQMLGKYSEALDMYKRIKSDYPRSFEGVQIDKYISYTESKIAQ